MRRGMSLIAVIITIIVMIILAGAIIINLASSNSITNLKEAMFKANIDTYKSELALSLSKKCLDDSSFDPTKFNAEVWDGTEGNIEGTIKEYINSMTAVDAANFEIHYGKLVYVGEDETEKEYSRESNILVAGKIKSLVTEWDEFFTGRNIAEDRPSEQTGITTLVAYDMWGKPVNLDLWNYCVISNATYGEVGTYCLNSTQNSSSVGYKGISGQTITEIIGEIPTVIYNTSTSTYKKVTSLFSTFNNCSNITTLPTIPNSVTNMGNTFCNCSKLTTSPTIPNRVANINNTFYGCSSLVEAPAIPSSVISMGNTFQNCSSLVEAPAISDNVTSMYGTFQNCGKLVEAPTIPSGVINMSYTFYCCSNLVTVPTIPDSVVNMDHTFSCCSKLVTAPTISNSVTNMNYTFSGCLSLVELPTIPSSVTRMSYTFQSCSKLVEAPTIPNSVTDMSYTFYGCGNLVTAPTIPNSVTNMNCTFFNCASLVTAPAIPNSVTSLNYVFCNCKKLTGDLIINASAVSSYASCLSGTSTAAGTSLVLSGTCPQLENIFSTRSATSNITKP